MAEKYRVMLVDDDQMNLEILEEIFEDSHTLLSVHSGEEALEKLVSFNPDLVLLDIMMPGINGYEVCQKIRQHPKFRNIKIILVSGKAMIEERLHGYDMGADDYVTKPFIEDELVAKVEVFLRLKRTEEMEQLKGDLLTLFSHETRTPISGIQGAADILKEEIEHNEDAQELVDMILVNCERLLDFLEKTRILLDVKRNNKLNKFSEPLRMHLEDAAQRLREKAKEKDVTIVTDISANLEMHADWGLIGRVFEYVIENAIKFSPNGENVNIVQELAPNHCVIKVTDMGGKIDSEAAEHIFDEFSITDINHHQSGQGLSLAIAQQVMRRHAGEIDVEALPGESTTFLLKFPLESRF